MHSLRAKKKRHDSMTTKDLQWPETIIRSVRLVYTVFKVKWRTKQRQCNVIDNRCNHLFVQFAFDRSNEPDEAVSKWNSNRANDRPNGPRSTPQRLNDREEAIVVRHYLFWPSLDCFLLVCQCWPLTLSDRFVLIVNFRPNTLIEKLFVLLFVVFGARINRRSWSICGRTRRNYRNHRSKSLVGQADRVRRFRVSLSK